MSNSCPVCASTLTKATPLPRGRDASRLSCPLCGDFIISRTLRVSLPRILQENKDASHKISHALRTMQQRNETPELYMNTADEILKRPLPTPKEQADLFIRWLAENVEGPGEKIWVEPATHRSIIGAKSAEGFALVLKHLYDTNLIDGGISDARNDPGKGDVTLSFKGWDYYEKLRHGGTTYRKAFMAMKFGVPELDRIFIATFKLCVKQAGFELYNLAERPKAGLIDDRLRVEIQSSDFLIADLTHDNPGAYWEAGYAEGLGKPVIYTCEKEKFKTAKTHFDTNHHLTILWDKNEPESAGEALKATIRATLPHLAKQVDTDDY